jgi:hypothetical protein
MDEKRWKRYWLWPSQSGLFYYATYFLTWHLITLHPIHRKFVLSCLLTWIKTSLAAWFNSYSYLSFPDGYSSSCSFPHSSVIQMTLSSCFLGKSGKMRSSCRTQAFQFYNQTFTSFPAWELAVFLWGMGQGTCVSMFLSPTKKAQ